ncbi:unnamed protein product, partial [Brassica rapa subsp. narinosa]
MPSLKLLRLCTQLLTIIVLYYLVFFRQLHVYICFGILFQLLYMVMMNCLLQICQRKRLKGIISL